MIFKTSPRRAGLVCHTHFCPEQEEESTYAAKHIAKPEGMLFMP